MLPGANAAVDKARVLYRERRVSREEFDEIVRRDARFRFEEALRQSLEAAQRQKFMATHPGAGPGGEAEEDRRESLGTLSAMLAGLSNVFGGSGVAPEQQEEERWRRAAMAAAKALQKEQRSRERKQELQESRTKLDAVAWRDEVLPHFTEHRRSGTLTKKLAPLCWNGIPPAVRGEAWQRLVGNNLQINAELYGIMTQRAKQALKASRRRQADEEAAEGKQQGSGQAASEGSDPATSGLTPAGSRAADLPETYAFVFLGREESVHLIAQDLPRTFPQLGFFHDGGPTSTALESILLAYAYYRPDVGYVQGMSYLAAMLLLYMDAPGAFACLANLLANPLYVDFYCLDALRIERHIRAFDLFFRENLPLLHSHFQAEGVTSDQFFLDWALTLFSRALPLDVAARVWDSYLLHGEVFAMKTALGILRVFAPALAQMDLGGILRFLRRLPSDKPHFSSVLFDAIKDIRVSPARLGNLVAGTSTAARDPAREGPGDGCTPM